MRAFIEDLSKIFLRFLKPLCKLLAKEVIFEFDDVCLEAFHTLKKALISAPVL